MNNTILLSLAFALVFNFCNLAGMADPFLLMKKKDETSDLYIRQEFCFATGTWISDDSGDWLWDPQNQKYVQLNALSHKDAKRQREHGSGMSDDQEEKE